VADGAIIARRRIIRPLAARAARTYVAGPELADAVATCRSFGDRGIASTVSYWDGERDSPRSVADQCLAAIGELAESGLDCYLSIKAPALGYSSDLVSQIVERAAAANIGVHFDSLAPDTAGPTFDLIAELGGARLGCTLPGRWRRSREDAAWAVEHGLGVRIVKGQWPDPEGHDLDDRAGFLAVVDQLTKAPRVAVATHDLRLAREALQRLRTAGTACELELMHRLANRHVDGVPLRVYVPYGSPSLPYSIQRAMRQPRLAWRLLRDQVSGSALTARP
jgi:proline dehydrogenase